MSNETPYPKYFLVDFEIYVKIDSVNGEVIGTTDLGTPYQPVKAMINGHEVTKKEFEEGSAKRKKDQPLRRLAVSA